MARVQTIVTAVTCDMCGAEGMETFTIVIDAGVRQLSKPRVVDVCAACAEPIRSLQLDIRRVGVVTSADPANHRSTACPLCARDFPRSNVYVHLRDVHGLKPPKQPRKCPDCDVEAGNMVRHRAAAHAYDLVAAYMEGAPKASKAR
jgi:hypothetical protein